jgi:hypothetical protein
VGGYNCSLEFIARKGAKRQKCTRAQVIRHKGEVKGKKGKRRRKKEIAGCFAGVWWVKYID